MQVYALKLYNFLRFGEKNNSVVFDLSDEQKDKLKSNAITMDEIFEEVKKDPIKHIKEAKERGLERYVGILGRSNGSYDESNGCGKSSIMEGVCFANYDKIVRKLVNTDKNGEAGMDVVPKINGKFPEGMTESYVEQIFEESDKVYRIKRGRTFTKTMKGSSPFVEFECISENGVESESGHRKGDTNKNIDDVNVMDYELFTSSQMFAQNDSGKFLIGTDKTKKEMIIKMLKLETVVKECMEEIRKRKNVQDKKLQSVRLNLEVIEKNYFKSCSKWGSSNVIDDVLSYINARISLKQEDISLTSASILRIENEISNLEKSNEITILKGIQEDGVKAKSEKEDKEKQFVDQTKDVDKSISENNATISKKKMQKSPLESKVVSFKNSKVEIEDFISKFDMQKCTDYLAKVEKAKSSKPDYENTINEISSSRDLKIQEIAVMTSLSKSKAEEVYEMETAIKKNAAESSGDNFVCRSCKSEVSKSHIISEIEKLKSEISYILSEKSTKEKDLASLNENLTANKERLGKIVEIISNEPKVHSKIKEFEDKKVRLVEVNASIVDYNAQIDAITSEIDDVTVKVKECLDKKNEIKAKFDSELLLIQVKINDLRSRYEKAKEEARAITVKIDSNKAEKDKMLKIKSDLEKEIGSINNEIAVLKQQDEEIKEYSKSLLEESKKLERIVIIEEVFGLDGIQTRIIKKYLPLLNVYIKEYMDVMTEGAINVSLDINSRSEIVFNISGNSASSYAMLSGGEKMLVHLSVSIGLALLSFSRMAKKPEMICLDEVFGSLDNSHTEAVFKVLNKLSESFNRIVIISHKSEIQKVIKNNIVADKSVGMNGLSQIYFLGEFKVE